MNDCTNNSQKFDLTEHEINEFARADTARSSVPQRCKKAVAAEEVSTANTSDYWSIDDDPFFYPFGLLAHGNSAGKCAFVTWNSDYLLNFVFKVSAQTHRTKMTKVRLIIDPDDEILDVLITELNTLLLMLSGRVYYFSSVKSIRPIDWLSSGVRCMSSASAGFSLIRLHEQRLTLEVYRDAVCVGDSASTLLNSYDITFDTNLFDCPWLDEHFTLHSLTVKGESHLRFVEAMLRQTDSLRVGQEVHLFTVSGHVFALIAGQSARRRETTLAGAAPTDAADFAIELISSYTSNVTLMRVLLEQQMCLVFLECGSIDVWYMSTRSNGLRRKQHHTGAQYTHYHYASESGCFYYTDERCVVQLRFVYDGADDTCHVLESIKSLPGILAIAWAASLQQLVALSCNNFFYRMTFDNESDDYGGCGKKAIEFDDLNELYELNSARVAQLLQKTRTLHELTQAPQVIHTAIERQYNKRQLIGVAHKAHLYKRVCKAQLQYCTVPPTAATHNSDTMLLYTSTSWLMHSESLYAVLRFNVTDCGNAVFQAAHWQLHVARSDGATHVFHIPKSVLHMPLCIVVPLTQRRHIALPDFDVQLLTALGDANDSEHLILALPIELQTTPETYAQLFSEKTLRLRRLPTHNAERHATKYRLRLSDSMSFERICRWLKLPPPTAPSLTGENKRFALHFMTSTLHVGCVCVDRQWHLELESTDAVALYYMKLYLSKSFSTNNNENNTSKEQSSTAADKSIQSFHTFVERTYNMLLQQQHEQLPQGQEQQQDAERIYNQLRLGYSTSA